MKRYAVTIQIYINAESEEDVKELAEHYVEHLDIIHDNKATVTDVTLAEFGTINN